MKCTTENYSFRINKVYIHPLMYLASKHRQKGGMLLLTDPRQLAIIICNIYPPPSSHSSYPPCLIAVLGIRQADKKGEAPSLQDGFWGVEWDKSACWWRQRGEGGGLMALWDGATAWLITSQQPIPPPCMRTCVRVRQSGGMLQMCNQEKKGGWGWFITPPAKNTYSNAIKSENVSKTTIVYFWIHVVGGRHSQGNSSGCYWRKPQPANNSSCTQRKQVVWMTRPKSV